MIARLALSVMQYAGWLLIDKAEIAKYFLLAAVLTWCYLLFFGRQRLLPREAFSEESWKKIYYLSNGNGAEMRALLPLMQ